MSNLSNSLFINKIQNFNLVKGVLQNGGKDIKIRFVLK